MNKFRIALAATLLAVVTVSAVDSASANPRLIVTGLSAWQDSFRGGGDYFVYMEGFGP